MTIEQAALIAAVIGGTATLIAAIIAKKGSARKSAEISSAAQLSNVGAISDSIIGSGNTINRGPTTLMSNHIATSNSVLQTTIQASRPSLMEVCFALGKARPFDRPTIQENYKGLKSQLAGQASLNSDLQIDFH